MKPLLFLTLLACAGCQTPPRASLPMAHEMPLSPKSAALAEPSPEVLELRRTVQRQLQYIEALVSQNEALSAKPVPAATVPVEILATPPPAAKTAPTIAEAAPLASAPIEAMLTPNAEGVVDLVAATTTVKPGEPANPFKVRALPAEATKEVTLRIGGIVAGPVPCAVINDRLAQAGETIETLVVDRIEPDAVVLRHEHRTIKLNVGDKPVKIRLPI